MRVDRAVSIRKFECEIQRLRGQARDLESRGIWVSSEPEYPNIDVLFVPRRSLRLSSPIQQPNAANASQDMMTVTQIPNLASKAFKARINLSNFDMRAPSVEFLDPWDNTPLEYRQMFRAFEFEEQRGSHLVLLDDHPIWHRPYLCLRGIREYHEHPQHTGDDWMLYRPYTSAYSVVISIWRTTVDLVSPHLVFQSGQIVVHWVPERKC